MQTLKQTVAGAQILFVAFGAMVLVSLLTGLNPSMALLGAGIGTLLFQLLTKRKVPIFQAPLSLLSLRLFMRSTNGVWAVPCSGCLPPDLCILQYLNFKMRLRDTHFVRRSAQNNLILKLRDYIFAALIKWRGLAAVHRLLPPVVIGPVIIVIGLSVAKVASEMAMGQAGGEQAYPYIMFVFVMNRL